MCGASSLAPSRLPAHLFWGEVVDDVEVLPDFLWRLALDHVGDRQACQVQEGLDVQVVGSLWGIWVIGARYGCLGEGLSAVL